MNLQNDILDYFGADATEEMVRNEYTGKTYEEILTDLNSMWPQDENEKLAHRIFEWLN